MKMFQFLEIKCLLHLKPYHQQLPKEDSKLLFLKTVFGSKLLLCKSFVVLEFYSICVEFKCYTFELCTQLGLPCISIGQKLCDVSKYYYILMD